MKRKEMLLCFHHAGGSTMVFQKWMRSRLPFAVVPVEIPGRGSRCKEACLTGFRDVVRKVVQEILAEDINRDIFIYGHSLGALLGFEVAKELMRRKVCVKKLFVAGRVPPDQDEITDYRCSMGMDALKKELVRIGATPAEILENEEFCDYFLPVVFADYQLLESYVFDKQILHCPITAFSGSMDADAPYEQMMGWSAMTDEAFLQYRIEGSHFFPYEQHQSELLAQIAEEIMQIREDEWEAV